MPVRTHAVATGLKGMLRIWCALVDSNHRPPPCEGGALPLSQARVPTDNDSTDSCVSARSLLRPSLQE